MLHSDSSEPLQYWGLCIPCLFYCHDNMSNQSTKLTCLSVYITLYITVALTCLTGMMSTLKDEVKFVQNCSNKVVVDIYYSCVYLYMHSKCLSFMDSMWVWEIYCCTVLCFTAIASSHTNSGEVLLCVIITNLSKDSYTTRSSWSQQFQGSLNRGG